MTDIVDYPSSPPRVNPDKLAGEDTDRAKFVTYSVFDSSDNRDITTNALCAAVPSKGVAVNVLVPTAAKIVTLYDCAATTSTAASNAVCGVSLAAAGQFIILDEFETGVVIAGDFGTSTVAVGVNI